MVPESTASFRYQDKPNADFAWLTSALAVPVRPAQIIHSGAFNR